MKNIKEYISEKLYIDSNLNPNLKDKIRPNDKEIKSSIDELKKLAEDKGLIIKFRNSTNNTGDFTIFIYDKTKQSRYLVGYDGAWDHKYGLSFYNILEQAKQYIDNYKKKCS